MFLSKQNFSQNFFLVSKNFKSQKKYIFTKKIQLQKNFSQKKCWSKKILVKKNFSQKKILVRKKN